MRDLGDAAGAVKDRAAELMDRLREALSRALQAVLAALEPVRGAVGRAARPVGRVARPLGAAMLAVLRPVAPYISKGLWGALSLLASMIAGLLDLSLATGRRLRAAWAKASPQITPPRVLALVAAVAAVALIVSQFMDYRGIAIGKPGYKGSVGTVAPVPLRDVETAGSAHLFLLVPVGVAALALIGATLRRDWRLGRVLAGLGALGVVVSLLVDLPKGLDEGTASIAYYGAEAELAAGFWIQILSCGVLVLCGLLLSRQPRPERSAAATDPAKPSARLKAPGWLARFEAVR